jgi:hypothetical protein
MLVRLRGTGVQLLRALALMVLQDRFLGGSARGGSIFLLVINRPQ